MKDLDMTTWRRSIVGYRKDYRQIYSTFYDNTSRCNESWFIFLKRLVFSNSDFCIPVATFFITSPRYFALLSCTRVLFFLIHNYLFDFPGRKFFQAVLSMPRAAAFTWTRCSLCAANLFLFYRRTPLRPRVIRLLASGPLLLFRKTMVSFASCEKPEAKRIEVGATDKRETGLKKSNFHAAVKTLAQRFRARSTVLLPFTTCASNASMVTRRLTIARIKGAVISHLEKSFIVGADRPLVSRLEA